MKAIHCILTALFTAGLMMALSSAGDQFLTVNLPLLITGMALAGLGGLPLILMALAGDGRHER